MKNTRSLVLILCFWMAALVAAYAHPTMAGRLKSYSNGILVITMDDGSTKTFAATKVTNASSFRVGSKISVEVIGSLGATPLKAGKVDTLKVSNCLALGVISSLNSLGYGSTDKPFPIITGQDCELTAIKYILDGKQSMTVFLDAKVLSEKMVSLVNDLEAGNAITPDTTYNNGTKDVPTLLYDPVLIDKDNYTLLIDRGFYTEDDLK